MESKQLGASEIMVPEIGMGLLNYRGGVETLRLAIKLGACFLDTAETYGTETVVGQAVKGVRDRVFIATKVSGHHLRYDNVLRAAESSLRRLDIDYIDLYQVHCRNLWVPIRETMHAMETLVDRGLVRHIGVSNFLTSELSAAQKAMTKYPIVSNQILYNLNHRDIEVTMLPYCLENQVTIIAHTPLDSGRLAVRPKAPPSRAMQALGAIADRTQKTLAQVALSWCTSHPRVIAIPKSNSEGRVVENCEASDWRLSTEQIHCLDAAFCFSRLKGELGRLPPAVLWCLRFIRREAARAGMASRSMTCKT